MMSGANCCLYVKIMIVRGCACIIHCMHVVVPLPFRLFNTSDFGRAIPELINSFVKQLSDPRAYHPWIMVVFLFLFVLQKRRIILNHLTVVTICLYVSK